LTFFSLAVLQGCTSSATRSEAVLASNAMPTIETPGAEDRQDEYFSRRGPYQDGKRTIWEYRLVVTDTTHLLADGTHYKVFALGNQIPAPTLLAREGDWLRITLVNHTSVAHTIHSHGLDLPQRMDGANHGHVDATGEVHEHDTAEPPPPPVQPGDEFTYQFIARPAGTYFYHCHVNTNEHLARGMAGALIVLPRHADPLVEHDWVLLLQEWDSHFAQQGKPGDPRQMDGADFFTVNGLSFPNTPMMNVALGDRIRMRFINAGAQPHFMHLHGFHFLLTHEDGLPLREPILMDTVAVSPGQRMDVIFVANNPGEWPLHCHSSPHTTNAGVYPGGMMMHIVVGPRRFPTDGDGPVGPGTEHIISSWRDSAARFYAALDEPAGPATTARNHPVRSGSGSAQILP
jgi:FtsP/CotA-like multicopper oxidase with cupredoxin domain